MADNFENDSEKYLDSQLANYILERKDAEVKLLLEKDNDIKDLVDDTDATLLHYAAEYGNAIMTQYLIDMGCDIDPLDESAKTPLMLAVDRSHVEIIKILLDAGANVNIYDEIGRTVLQIVLQSGVVARSPEVIALFMEKVRVMCSDDDTLMAKTFMEVACDFIKVVALSRPKITKIMLESGCSIEDRDENYNTMLHVAVETMNLENIQLLIEYGACVNARGFHGKTPLFMYNMHYEDVKVKLEILSYLLDRGASLMEEDIFGMSPLTLFFSGADREILEVIMKYNVDLCACNRYNVSPLHYLVENKNPGVCEAIRGKKFDVNASNSMNYTPLMSVVKNYDLEKVEFFLEHGALVNCRVRVKTRFDTAIGFMFMNRVEDEKNVNEIIERLLRHGAVPDIPLSYDHETIFDLAEKNDYYYRIKPVIARLVLRETTGRNIYKTAKQKIEENPFFKHQYEKCKLQVRQMRYKIVHASVSLFKLLFESEDKIEIYARNYEFKGKFNRMMERVKDFDKYILDTLKNRVNKAIEVAELKRNSATVISHVTKLPIATRDTILYKIVNYLGRKDLENLLKM